MEERISFKELERKLLREGKILEEDKFENKFICPNCEKHTLQKKESWVCANCGLSYSESELKIEYPLMMERFFRRISSLGSMLDLIQQGDTPGMVSSQLLPISTKLETLTQNLIISNKANEG